MIASIFPRLIVVLASVPALLVGLRFYQRRYRPNPEWVRKLMHVGSGLIACTLPALFESAAPVLFLCTTTFLGLLALRYLPWLKNGVARVVCCVNRRSGGDLYFPVAVGLVFLFAGRNLILYLVPILILTFADTAAALVGSRYGSTRLWMGRGEKSLEGSVAFLVVSLLIASLALSWMGQAFGTKMLVSAALVSLLLAVIEAMAGRGLDNLLIPVCGLLLMRIFEQMEARQLILWLGASVAALTPLILQTVLSGRGAGWRRDLLQRANMSRSIQIGDAKQIGVIPHRLRHGHEALPSM